MEELKTAGLNVVQLDTFAEHHAHVAYFTSTTLPKFSGALGMKSKSAFDRAAVASEPPAVSLEPVSVLTVMETMGLSQEAKDRFCDIVDSVGVLEALHAAGVAGRYIYVIRKELALQVFIVWQLDACVSAAVCVDRGGCAPCAAGFKRCRRVRLCQRKPFRGC